MGIIDVGKCIVFCLISAVSFVLIFVTATSLVQFLSPFHFPLQKIEEHRRTGDVLDNEDSRVHRNYYDMMTSLPGLGTIDGGGVINNYFKCSPPNLGREGSYTYYHLSF